MKKIQNRKYICTLTKKECTVTGRIETGTYSGDGYWATSPAWEGRGIVLASELKLVRDDKGRFAGVRRCVDCGFRLNEYAKGETLCGACYDEKKQLTAANSLLS